jgi:hypothetical protein
LTFSNLMPRSSEITLPPVKIAMSSSIACGDHRSRALSRRRCSMCRAVC